MKKLILATLLAVTTQAALSASAEQTNANSSIQRPVPQEYYRRFVAIDTVGRRGFFWLDSTNGHLWEFDQSLGEWEDHGKGEGMESGSKGTYLLWSDNRDGVYVLHTDTGCGWWFTGTGWEIIDPADSEKKSNNIY